MMKQVKWRLPDISWPIAIVLYSVFIGFLVTANGVTNWDDNVRIRHSKWLLGEFGLGPVQGRPSNYSYAPLWELILGILNTFVFSWMHDQIWVRHAFTFALLPLGLSILYVQLRREGISKWGSTVFLVGITGYIRLIGHATTNVKDFPAAIVFLVCTVEVWRMLRHIVESPYSLRRLSLLGILSALPFLVRSPLITLLPLSMGVLLLHVMKNRKEMTALQAITMIVLPAISAALFIAVLSPALWLQGNKALSDAMLKFAHYPWPYTVRTFGLEYVAKDAPFWYALTWIPIGIHPAAFGAFLLGCILLVRHRRSSIFSTLRYRFFGAHLSISFADWICLVTAVSFACILAVRPTLYNEDRHVLFLMLLLYSCGFLGLEFLSDRIKKIIITVMLIWSVLALWRWSIYSYIYKSPLFSAYPSYMFTNDYWGACSTKAAHQIAQVKLKSVPFSYQNGASHIAVSNTLKRLSEGFFTKSETVIARTLRAPNPGEGFWYLLGIQSIELMNNPAELRARSIKKLWQDALPTGETACALYFVQPL